MVEWSRVRIPVVPLRNLDKFVYPTLCFGLYYNLSRWSLLSGVSTRGSVISNTGSKCVTCRGLHNSEINHPCVSSRMDCLEYITNNKRALVPSKLGHGCTHLLCQSNPESVCLCCFYLFQFEEVLQQCKHPTILQTSDISTPAAFREYR